MCMCWVSFLTTLDIYKTYFIGRHTCIEGPSALFTLKEATVSLCQRVFVTKEFLNLHCA